MRYYESSITIKYDTEATGNFGAFKEVTVFETGSTTNKASLLDINGMPTTNPVISNKDGDFGFFIADGTYDIYVDYGLVTQKARLKQQIANIIGSSEGSSFSEEKSLSAGLIELTFFVVNSSASFYLCGNNVDSGRLCKGANADYTIKDDNTITLNNSYPTGTVIVGVQNDIANNPPTGFNRLFYNNQDSDSYTLQSNADDNDEGKVVSMTSSSANIIIVEKNTIESFAVGANILLRQLGEGVTTITASSGVTLNGVDGGSVELSKFLTYSIDQVTIDNWVLTGSSSVA